MTETTPQTDESPSNFTRLRALLFLVVTLAVGAVIIVLMTWWVVGSAPRSQAIALDEQITVAEYITLPDDDSYPAALAIADDGTLYTGSYASGAIWSITPDGFISEVADTREKIGSVSGLDIAPDGALVILDRVDPLDAKGATIWRYQAGELTTVVQIPHDATVGVVLPDDIAVDQAGYLYITDRDPARIWRYTADGVNQGVWWTPPMTSDELTAPTGLAYDASNDAILVTDSEQDAIYRIPATSATLDEALASSELLYSGENDYSFDGIDVSPMGGIYVTLLSWNRVARLDGSELVMLARDFRGASDVVYDSTKDVLFITNWNQFSLGFGTSPQLPFALDILDLSPDSIAE